MSEQRFDCYWRHGPAPGLTYYDGCERGVVAEDAEHAEQRARRLVAARGCFSPGCLTFYRMEQVS